MSLSTLLRSPDALLSLAISYSPRIPRPRWACGEAVHHMCIRYRSTGVREREAAVLESAPIDERRHVRARLTKDVVMALPSALHLTRPAHCLAASSVSDSPCRELLISTGLEIACRLDRSRRPYTPYSRHKVRHHLPPPGARARHARITFSQADECEREWREPHSIVPCQVSRPSMS